YESEENFQTQEIKRLKTLGFEKQNPIQVRVLTLNAYWTLRLVVIGQLLVNCIYFTWLGCVRFSDSRLMANVCILIIFEKCTILAEVDFTNKKTI
ncbi:hypothetical protein TYRP_000362, partial [Tyrophagus putrescentiae]